MRICDQCGFRIFQHNAPCPRCAEESRLAQEALAPEPKSSRWPKILKWLLVGLTVAALAATLAIAWILNSFGESLRSLG